MVTAEPSAHRAVGLVIHTQTNTHTDKHTQTHIQLLNLRYLTCCRQAGRQTDKQAFTQTDTHLHTPTERQNAHTHTNTD